MNIRKEMAGNCIKSANLRNGRRKRREPGSLRGWGLALGIVLFCMRILLPVSAREETPEELENLYAYSAVLMDGDSGRILYGKNEEESLPMASTTKIMTCILALELGKENDLCRVSDTAAAQPRVHLGMRAGESYYLKDLLYSMMLESHNDSAVCVAEHIGGSVEGFARLMNEKAEELGCTGTHFVTPNGLDETDDQGAHSSTATDLARIMRYCIALSPQREKFLSITQTSGYRFADASGKRTFSCVNHNALLSMVEGTLSGKTGYTGAAGYCYVGAVCQKGETLIGALLACGWPGHRGYKWSDMRRLLDYGFSHYEKKSIALSGVELPQVTVENGIGDSLEAEPEREETLSVLLAAEEELKARVRLPETIRAPVAAGSRAGSVEILAGEDLIGEYDLIYREGMEELTWGWCLKQVMEQFFSGLQRKLGNRL